MPQLSTQFDTFETVDLALAEIRGAANAVIADIERVQRLRDKLAVEFDRLRAERDAIEIYDEAAVAAMLGLSAFTLGEMRRKNRGRFPHIAFGQKVMYTRRHIVEICEMYETGGKKSLATNNTNITNLRKVA